MRCRVVVAWMVAVGCGGATPAPSPVPAPPAAAPAPGSLAEAEAFFRDRFLPYQLGPQATTIEDARAQKEALDDITRATQALYLPLWHAADLDGRLAARVRFGETFGYFADKFGGAPPPRFVLELERRDPSIGAEAAWRSALARNLARYYQAAVDHCREALALADQTGHHGRWRERAERCVARWRPSSVPAPVGTGAPGATPAP